MARPEMQPGSVGDRWTVSSLANGNVSVRGRGRLRDRSRQNPITGEWEAGARVELTVRMSAADSIDRHKVTAALTAALIERELSELAKLTARAEAEISPTWTVAKLADEALSALAVGGTVRPTSIGVYRSHLNAHLNDSELGRMPYGTVRPAHVKAYVLSLAGTVGISTAKQGRAVANRAFQHAVDLGHLDANPCREIGVLRQAEVLAADPDEDGRDHKRALSTDEAQDLVTKLSADRRAKNLDLVDLVVAGMSLGGRLGEMIAIRWRDVTFTGESTATIAISGTITRAKGEGLRRTVPKSRAGNRVIPVSGYVVEILRARAARAGVDLDSITEDVRPVFPSPGRWAYPGESITWRDVSNTTKDLRKAFDRAGYGWLIFHSLRRTVLTNLAKLGMLDVAALVAGHTDTRTTSEWYVVKDSTVDATVTDYLGAPRPATA